MGTWYMGTYTTSRIAVGPRVQYDTLASAYLKKKEKKQQTYTNGRKKNPLPHCSAHNGRVCVCEFE